MPGSNEGENVIRITHEDANSDHVESLLRRQMSLRGEKGITAVKKRRWFYQSWFILMISAGLLAFAAWALIEPFFDDMPYLQGPIVAANFDSGGSPTFASGSKQMELSIASQGWIQIGSQRIWLVGSTRMWEHKKAGDLNKAELTVGREVRAYVEPVATSGESVVIAGYLDPSPKPISASRAAMALPQIQAQHSAAGLLLFPIVAGFIGIGVAAADGLICRLPRRALLSGAVGLLVGILGGFIAVILAGLVYMPLNHLATAQMVPGARRLSAFAFFVQLCGRGLAWMLAGSVMGLGQGIALRSKRLLLYGFLGGLVGGLLGGLLFDPIDLLLLGMDKPSAEVARMVGITVIGLCVGALIGVVELLARNAWLRMTEGPLSGKEFLLFKDTMRIGASSKSDIYLFNDPEVAPQHAIIRTISDQSEIDSSADAMVLVNTRPTRRARLRHGDQITIGRTSFLFQSRKG